MARYISKLDWLPTDGIELTSEQNTVLKITDKNIAITAGPGTGKTEVLAQKATYLLQTGLCQFPFRILALSYKVDAASNIRERVKKRCPRDLSYRFSSMTVDAFILSLVRRFATSLPKWLKIQKDFEMVTNIDDADYLRSSNATYFPDEYRKDVSILQENVSEEIKQLYLYAARNNCFDYNMCHTMAYYIVNHNPDIRKLVSRTYKYIFLDEFQDVNGRHYKILESLFNNQYNKICAVGDDKQAIMGWAGAIPDIFSKFQSDYAATLYSFTYNHRSTIEIVQFINTVVHKLTPMGHKPIEYRCLSSFPSPHSFIAAQSFDSVVDESAYIAQCINKILRENRDLTPSDIAIILKQRTADYLLSTKGIFEKYGILVRNEDELVCSKGLRYQDLMVDTLSKLIVYFLKLKLKLITIVEQKELLYLLLMTVRFPDLLPLPLVEDYSITPNEAIIRTQMESGTARQRRRFDAVPSKITVKWFMNASQFSLFEAWYKYHAKEGAEWFVINLLGGLGLIEQEARFTQQFTAKLQNGILWAITSELEIRERPTLSEGALDILLSNDFEKLSRSVNHLHE